ncbi:hypothetical protein IWQ62_001731 [Dispira parvispora]|uniref:tRNA (guanine(10)-N(2))-methyltransferase n=1 Tax=Dispira parvispora TaxID=1520584 RepID=A0A9W8AUC4_9FUNG|nr:hypothetical protein IWQ62_001731 [Dispira parvispora]
MRPYLIHFAQFHPDFRLAELEALARLENVALEYDPTTYSNDNPFLLVRIPDDVQACKLVQRSILVKEVCEHWASAPTYEALFEIIRQNPQRWEQFNDCSFKFMVKCFGGTRTIPEQVEIINRFAFLGFSGPIDLKNPQEQFVVYEDYGIDPALHRVQSEPMQVHFGRLLALSNRGLVGKFNLKKRNYLGNTSMDAELSLVMANQALARPGALVYDPFVGTGSFLLTCAHFGALTMGSDIDGRQIRGSRTATNGIQANVEQYNLGRRVLDTVVFDISRNPWRQHGPTRTGPWFDAIVTDPPYGVRAGAKRLGRKSGLNPDLSFVVVDGQVNHLRTDYYPPTVPYEMSEVITDLLEFAARFLVLHGRLVYWLPTVVDEYTPQDIPEHPCLRLLANSEQPFGSWSRRLVTMEKIREWDESCIRVSPHYIEPPAQQLLHKATPCPLSQDEENAMVEPESTNSATIPGEGTPLRPANSTGHYNFREKYFSGFDRS